jgi:hypothetical protein
MKDGKGNNLTPLSTAEYNPFGWRACLNNTTITRGVNNVFDLAPAFVASTTNIKGRIWYVALTKRW